MEVRPRLAALRPAVLTFAKGHYDLTDDLHGWPHVQRVFKKAMALARGLDIDEDLLASAVFLHDIGRKFEAAQGKNHAVVSVELARPFFAAHPIGADTLKALENAILSHSFSLGVTPASLEAKILSDADKLDALGAVGVYRVCAYQAAHGGGIQTVIHHCEEKLFKLRRLLYLEAAQKEAAQLTDRVRGFQFALLEETANLDGMA